MERERGEKVHGGSKKVVEADFLVTLDLVFSFLKP